MVAPRRLLALPGSRRRQSLLLLVRPSLIHSISTSGHLHAPSSPGDLGDLRPARHIRSTQPEPATGGDGRRDASSSHPWPEWVELIERLLQRGYVEDADGFSKSLCLNSKDSNRIRTACLDFARDRFDLFKYLSKKDIKVIVECGCPSLDRKVVNSGKRLRAHLGIREINVCGTCNLRGNCDRAYVEVYEAEVGRTVDVMRVLLTYASHMMSGSVDGHFPLYRNVRESAKKLLKDMLTLSTNEPKSEVGSRRVSSALEQLSGKETTESNSNSTREGDWICPKCDFLNFKKNIRCLRCDELSQEKLKKLREEREHLPLKRGDWICSTCKFFNFAKNTKCLQCGEKPTQRHLGPGEWECPSCYFVNFRRNTICLRCDWKRPKALVAKTVFADLQPDANKQTMVHSRVSQCCLQPEHPSQSNEKEFWSSDDDDDINNSKTILKFEDFSIVGGKNGISKDAHGTHKLKDENKLIEKSKVDHKTNSRTSANFRRPVLHEVSDNDSDDEISEWFCHKVSKNNS